MMIGFKEILQQKRMQHQNVRIDIVPNSDIVKHNHEQGMAKPIFQYGKLKFVHVLIAEELDEMMKIKILFHELGHVKDYFNRNYELENIESKKLDNRDFNAKSEFFAFENSLNEGLALYKNGRKDVLESLVENIPKRKFDEGYFYGVTEIEKTDLWKQCTHIVNSK